MLVYVLLCNDEHEYGVLVYVLLCNDEHEYDVLVYVLLCNDEHEYDVETGTFPLIYLFQAFKLAKEFYKLKDTDENWNPKIEKIFKYCHTTIREISYNFYP